MSKFWVVWNPQRDIPTHRHGTRDEAELEANRLLAKYPHEHFFVLVAEKVFHNEVDITLKVEALT